jgi:hypothetical protein
MATDENIGQGKSDSAGFGGFAFSRIILVILISCGTLWLASMGISYIHEKNIAKEVEEKYHEPYASSTPAAAPPENSIVHETEPAALPAEEGHGVEGLETPHASIPVGPPGVAFVDATIKPLHYELHERFWGWRPNDYIRVTDNVNEFQKGVLEVTRKTAVILFERISRTGSTVSFDINLENAQNWFMIQANRLYFPFFQSPERQYDAGLQDLKKYRNKLVKGKATFFNRSDRLIPLLEAYRNLLGSCDDNLVKSKEPDGKTVSSFDADNYFYYAQGVASAMETILKAVEIDFHSILESRHGLESLEHAIGSCNKATQMNPWVITEASVSGVFANHRANMATAISHARFYLDVLIETLST